PDTAADAPLVTVDDLRVRFASGDKTVDAVKGVSFTIGHGEIVALVGESGSGKSVSALSIMKLLPYPTASHPSGSIHFNGTELIGADEGDMRKLRGNAISIVFQEPMTSLNPLQTVETQVAEVLEVHQFITGAEARTRVIELLTEVGIRDPESRLASYPHQLSGGQRQRVMIAMALANTPDLLIADEPTTALDVTIQAQILELMKSIIAEKGMSMLLITHDLGVVRKMADRVYVMQNGEIVESGETIATLDNPQHAYTQHLLAAEPKGEPPIADTSAPVVIEATDMKVWFPIKRGFFQRTVDHVKAVDGLSLTVRAGQTVGVVGESGSGKTTLGLALLQLVEGEGTVAFLGREINGLSSKQMRPLRRDLQVVFQDPYGALSPRLSVGQIIAEGLEIQQPDLSPAQVRDRVAKALEDTGLPGNLQDRYPHEFSGGQRQRIAIARAMVLEPKFIMLDEPTSALDMSVQAQIVDLLRDLQAAKNLAYLFISHDLKVVRALSNELIVMQHGKVVEAGPAAEIFANPSTDYTRALLKAAFDLEAA
ncbi:MAG: ABC transporter ATP-binding protein, partial [Pseudomonadota bacterium]